MHDRALPATLRIPNRLESTMLRQIAPSGEELIAVRARFGIAQDSQPLPEALLIQRGIRARVAVLAERLATEIEPSRELSLALTHLEEALMWAGKAIFK